MIDLRACAEVLTVVYADWQRDGLIDDAAILLAAVTPRGCKLLGCSIWPEADEVTTPALAARCVTAAIDGVVTEDAREVIAAGVSLLLGKAWLDNFCRNQPLDDFVTAVGKLATELNTRVHQP
jgi:hypothetical protein